MKSFFGATLLASPYEVLQELYLSFNPDNWKFWLKTQTYSNTKTVDSKTINCIEGRVTEIESFTGKNCLN